MQITLHTMLHENIKKLMEGFQYDAHPMGVFLSTVGAFSTFYPDAKKIFDEQSRKKQIHRLIAKVPSIGAYAYRHSIGRPYIYPDNDLSFAGNFLNMLFRMTELKYQVNPVLERAHRGAVHPARRPRAELQHERDARDRQLARRSRTRRWPAPRRRSTVRCTAAPTKRCCGCSPRSARVQNIPGFIKRVKAGEGRLMGFGHRVYKSYDPRAKIIKQTADAVFEVTGKNPLLDIALELERIALEDEYFVSRKLYPNVDFYSGLIYQAHGLPGDDVPGAVRDPAHVGLGRAVGGDAARPRAEDRAAEAGLHRRQAARLRSAVEAR